MKKILVAYDGSLLSRKAIEEAKKQAKFEQDVHVYILAVMKATGPSTNITITRNMENELKDKLEPQMISIRKEFEQLGIQTTSDIKLGDPNENPGKKICQYADENAIDLIIAGSRGLNKVTNLLLGSVSSNIVHYANCPILIMK